MFTSCILSERCSLCPWEKRLYKTEFLAYQVSARGGFLREKSRDTGRGGMGGQAMTVWSGTLT